MKTLNAPSVSSNSIAIESLHQADLATAASDVGLVGDKLTFVYSDEDAAKRSKVLGTILALYGNTMAFGDLEMTERNPIEGFYVLTDIEMVVWDANRHLSFDEIRENTKLNNRLRRNARKVDGTRHIR